jgi:hypothetical protein
MHLRKDPEPDRAATGMLAQQKLLSTRARCHWGISVATRSGKLATTHCRGNGSMAFSKIGLPAMKRPRCVLDTEAVKIGSRKRLRHPSSGNHISLSGAVHL